MKLYSLLRRSKQFAHRSRRVRISSYGSGRRRRKYRGGELSPKFKERLTKAGKIVGTLGAAYAAYKYGSRPLMHVANNLLPRRMYPGFRWVDPVDLAARNLDWDAYERGGPAPHLAHI
jgi:hypothetical protein